MKYLKIIFLTVVLGLGLANASANTPAEKEIAPIEISSAIDNLSDEVKITAFEIIRTEESFKCTINVSTTLDDGTTIEGTLVFEDIGFFRCAALKIADLFSGEF